MWCEDESRRKGKTLVSDVLQLVCVTFAGRRDPRDDAPTCSSCRQVVLNRRSL